MQNKYRKVIWPIPFVLLVAMTVFCFGVAGDPQLSPTIRFATVGVCITLLCIGIAAYTMRKIWWQGIRNTLEGHTNNIDGISDKHVTKCIILASALGLYMELLVIRWHSSCFGVFAHFKNVSLLSCFLGLGIGYALGRRRPLCTPLFLPALAIQVAILHFLQSTPIQHSLGNPIIQQAAHGLAPAYTPVQKAMLYGFLVLIFTFNMLNFIPLGQLTSRLMLRRPKLISYGWNLMGSLLGIGVFSALSFTWSPPSIWIVLGTIGMITFLYKDRKTLFLSASCIALTIAFIAIPSSMNIVNIYSPYQIISLHTGKSEPTHLLVNHTYHQRILDLSFDSQSSNEDFQRYAAYYELPYLFKPAPERVLVVGSGTGNDVAAALRRGARHIDAVEIDPVILECGRRMHPEMPYNNSKVRCVVNDARTFVRQTSERYDLIVYGLLDAHTLLSGMSTVRLDSFVYTVEAFREARAKLKDDGVIFMSFSLFTKEHGRKLFLMLKEAFDGKSPRAYRALYDYAFPFVIGNGTDGCADTHVPFKDVTDWFDDEEIVAHMSTDDWPFFYMPVRTYPTSYAIMIIIFSLVSVLSIYQAVPGAGEGFSVPCFFLGAGFMLIETKSITELGLTFGNTWMVISVVITGILLMAFLANLFIVKFGPQRPFWVYSLLSGFLIAGMLFSRTDFTFLPLGFDKILMTALLTVPIFFSGLAFSGELAEYTQVPAALSSNLIGAMFGGFLEYNSMYFGFRSLYVLALVMYCLAFFWPRRAKS
jgi:SAM-dependent methyltransferase